MSQYTHIFLHKNHEYIEVSCTNSSDYISKALYLWTPCGKIHKISLENFTIAIDWIKSQIESMKIYIKDNEDLIKLIATFNNPIHNKFNAIEEIHAGISEQRDYIEEAENALMKLTWLKQIAADEDNGVDVYAGVECGSDVTDADRDDCGQTSAAPNVNLFDGDLQ